MKKIVALFMVCVMALSLMVGCGSKEGDDAIKVGAIYINSKDDTSGYTYAHHNGITKAMENLGISSDNLYIIDNVPEDDIAVTNAIDNLAGKGCNIIFGISFGYITAMAEAAEKEEYKDIIFSHGTGYLSNDTNFNNYFGRIYQARYLAGIAAGNIDEDNNFIGAAPESDILVVKLKQAKQNLRDFFYLSSTTPIYQENDIMAAISYLNQIAEREGKPLVILLGIGSNQGSHAGSDPLSLYCNHVGARRERCVVIPTGNQAAKRHHFFGEATSLLEPVRVEMDVEANFPGFCVELWTFAPELVRAVVQSPTGQQSEGRFPITEETQTTRFVFENTTVTMDYRIAGRQRGDLLIFFRFSNVVKGIWTLLIYPENAITGAFHIWLPIREETEDDITFIRPNPDTTLTAPSSARIPITVGGYNGLTDALYLESGRGFDALGGVKPDFVAPCVEVTGAGLRNNYVMYTGTSVAAAITAGASAQVLQWGVVQGNAPGMNSVEVKNTLIRGCRRDSGMVYPNRESGFGKLDVYQSFENLR